MTTRQVVEVRVPANLAQPLKVGVAYTKWRESVVFGLASEACLPDRRLLLVKKLVSLPDSAYVSERTHGASWRGSEIIPVINEALSDSLGIIIFHKHAGSGPVELSRDDRESAERLIPVFQSVIPLRSHASIVFGDGHAAGIVLVPDGSDCLDKVRLRWVGQVIEDFGDRGARQPVFASDEGIYQNQRLLIGGRGQAVLRCTRVAVVGLSGGGSHVVQQLAHMGIGEIVGIDEDRVEQSNRSRMIGSRSLDALFRRRKISVMSRLVRRINRHVQFVGVPHNVPKQEAIDALKSSDIVVGCVDNYHAKADLQELTWRYLIPYVDIGLLIRPVEDGDHVAIGGNVGTFIPGSFCQWCIGFLTDAKLSTETGGRARSYFEGADKQAQVVSMNGLLASQAVTEVLQLLTGFARTGAETSIRKFDGIEGTLTKWDVGKKAGCSKCQSALAAGEVIWKVV